MIAVIYDNNFNFKWIKKTIGPVDSLPEGYDELLTEDQLNKIKSDSLALYEAEKEKTKVPLKFKEIREKFQEMSDKFASDNLAAGITTAEAKALADKFSQVKYYLELNVPMAAIAEVDNIDTDELYLTNDKKIELKNELLEFIQAVFIE